MNSTNKRRLFGTSGIRGVVGHDLTEESCHRVGRAVGSILAPGARVCLATDTRVSGEAIKSAVISGLVSSSVDVVDLGVLPTPALAFLTGECDFDTGFMVTASHNPPEFNGIKLFGGDSLGYSRAQEEEIERVYFARTFRGGYRGTVESREELRERYIHFLNERFSDRLNTNLKLVIDPGNGAASGLVTTLFAKMGMDIVPLNDEPDGLFPGRSPEPNEETLKETVQFLRQKDADIAVCFDGDADRVVFCDREGFLGFNEMIAFISRLVINETGKKRIATTVEAGRLLDLAVDDLGAEVIRGKVGDVNVAHLVRELDAALGVEQVGVYIIPNAGYYPDSIFAALTLLSHLEEVSEIRQFFNRLPQLFFQKGKVYCPNQLKETVMNEIRRTANLLRPSSINTLDGTRLEFDDSWMLIRASGTESAIRVIAESTSLSRAKELLDKGGTAIQSCLMKFGKEDG